MTSGQWYGLEWKVSLGGPPLRSSIFIPWFKLQCALLSVWGGDGMVLGKSLQGIQQDKTGATMTFKVTECLPVCKLCPWSEALEQSLKYLCQMGSLKFGQIRS
ncbi:hypothetical protein DUNSADRAFT_8251 [Dunaliella salina]|uniref:Uncharacterized protein n=1 Tax=Dunaliella salina TaxID=3046 RepID=A0ABQ7HA70_DUNSA|nr:hypothetical protein DUNSADRAFT_8251 [Dunaliella salina]|eukprot:KAF5843735.1 hypothetical protein DUNSADRAFT_8251 [Dunaliella salina]